MSKCSEKFIRHLRMYFPSSLQVPPDARDAPLTFLSSIAQTADACDGGGVTGQIDAFKSK